MTNEERFRFLEENKYFESKTMNSEEKEITYTYWFEQASYHIHIPMETGGEAAVTGGIDGKLDPEWLDDLYEKAEEEIETRDKLRMELNW